jgi:hypothetical protein
MLTTTLRMLKDWRPGKEEPEQSFDEAELSELAALLKRLLYAPASLRQRLQEAGVSLVPANFYSEIPLLSEVKQSFSDRRNPAYDTCFQPAVLERVLGELSLFSAEFDPPTTADRGIYSWRGGQFSFSDAMAYYCMVRRNKPATILEIGSGWSTLVADLALRANGAGRIICLEPYPTDFLKQIPSVAEIIQTKAQDVPIETFNSILRDGDILFIDSTHTVKHGSDCLHIYLQILPKLGSSLTIHAHDIYLPATMPLDHFTMRNLSWTEQYLLYAYLLENSRTTTLFASNWHMLHNRRKLDAFMHGRFPAGDASFWFEQRAPDKL